jgi:Ca2+-binding RTX toxin-like protein
MSTPPTILLSNSSVSENSPLGQVVGTFTILDLSFGESLSLLDDAGGRFGLDQNNNLIVIGLLDFEESAYQSILVGLSGSATTYEESFLIAVDNVEGVTVKLKAADSALGWFRGSLEQDDITGCQGADLIAARWDDDLVNGRGGDDLLIGGLGQDALFGGRGADRFIYRKVHQSSVAAPDVIHDFNHNQGDVIDLRAIGGHRFDFIGNAAFGRNAGELRFDTGTHLLEGDIDGDGTADFAIQVQVENMMRGDLVL